MILTYCFKECVGQVKRVWICCERSSQKKKNRAVKRGEMDGAECLAFSWTLPTCLKTGWLNGVAVIPVSDLVIMLSVSPMPSVSFRTRRMCSTHSIFSSTGFTNVSHFGIGGINVYTLRADYFSLIFCVACSACWQELESLLHFLKCPINPCGTRSI